MTYASTRNPERKIKLLRQVGNEVIAREVSTGEEITLTRNTLNRWWKRVEDVVETPKKAEEPKSEATKEVKSLVKALAKKEKEEPKLDKPETTPVKKKRTTRKEREAMPAVVILGNERFTAFAEQFVPFCKEHSIHITSTEKIKNTLGFLFKGRGILRVYLGRRHIKIDCKSSYVPEHIHIEPQNHYYNAKIFCSEDECVDIVKELLKLAIV